jgi:heme a synthase
MLLSLILVANAVVLVHRASEPDVGLAVRPVSPEINRHVMGIAVLTALALVTGTVVTGAGPHGGDDRAARLNLDVAGVARTHSLTVWAFLALVVALAVVLGRERSSRRAASSAPGLGEVRRLLILAVAQGGVGYLQYVLDVPPLLVGLHVLGATLVWAATVQVALEVFDGGGGRLDRRWRSAGATRASRGDVPVLSGR